VTLLRLPAQGRAREACVFLFRGGARRVAFVALVALSLSAGCTPKRELVYRWGIYEDLVYDMYATPGGGDPGTQLAALSEDVARTHQEGKRVPPGIHAHLGYLYFSQGQLDAAHEQFTIEKELFPESAVFVDGILERMKQKR